ncbi:amino acid adenylation domain-containing protein [Luteimonas sp. MC1782]|uniref:amino acid adenylation domain-containing protein n=1 Tax=Luteimonas sp. MC1782 TaxID=2760305 RepID=UPI001602D3BA|nr:amino acid adenylation domain-containing protein [Luteimonas sp. MC1782]MBB1473150.1 amino acid adenylation domain-containing protein [Luteimonas sp. MC1782]
MRIDHYVASWARARPRSVAVVQGQRVLDFGALDNACSALALRLRRAGVERGTRVGLQLASPLDALLSTLAVLRAGGTCVPLAAGGPVDGQRGIVAQAGISLVLADGALRASFDGVVRMSTLDALPAVAADATSFVQSEDHADDIAFMVCSPGSDHAQCARISHGNMVGIVRGIAGQVFGADGIRMLVASAPHQPQVLIEWCLPLVTGGTVVLADHGVADDVDACRRTIDAASANAVVMAPEALRQLFDAQWSGGKAVKILADAGTDAPGFAEPLFDRCAAVWRFHGAIGATPCATLHHMQPGESRVLLGRPLPGVTISIRDGAGREVPRGIPGEVCVSGVGTAGEGPAGLRTGAMARLLADGTLEYRGRNRASAPSAVQPVAGKGQPARDAGDGAPGSAVWNETQRTWEPVPSPYLHRMIEQHARLAPDAVAVVAPDGSLTYGQLDARAQDIARRLRALGVRAGDRVALCAERGLDMVAGILGALKSGAAYVPMDPAYPRDRLVEILVDSGAKALLLGPGLDGSGFASADNCAVVTLHDVQNAAADGLVATCAADGLMPTSPAYVIYTSGSTGKPKGVVVPHCAVVNLFHEAKERPGLSPEDIVLATVSMAFDPSVADLLFPLAVGARVVIADRDTVMDGAALAQALTTHRATLMIATPSGWQLLASTAWRPEGRFVAWCGGEALSTELASRLLGRGIELWNLYGPTETTVWSTSTRIEANAGGTPDIHIGRPIANTTVWVLDEQGDLCPVGVSGEICIGGAGVALGYLGRPGLTAGTFIEDRIAPRDHGTGLPPRLYRTGDRGRWRSDGVLEHQGRIDFQVKVRGYRIEPGEIEAVLESAPEISRAVVVVREDQPGDLRIVGYMAGTDVDEAALQSRLRATLPGYMVPQHLVLLDALPLLPNGKIDRKALPAPQPGHVPVPRPAAATPAAPQPATAAAAQAPGSPVDASATHEDPRVAYLVAVWTEILGAAASPEDNFFDLGGHSMLAAKLANRVARETGHRIRLMPLATRTLAQLASDIPASALPSPAAVGDAPITRLPDATRDAGAGERAFFFGTTARRMFGMVHRASPASDSGVPILVAPPLLLEGVTCQRALWTLCESVSAQGGDAMRFDWYGTGDSAGGSGEVTLPGLQVDLRLASQRLPRGSGQRMRVVAFRSASLPVLAAAVAGAQAVDLVLWDPVVCGGPLVEEWRRQHAVQLAGRTRFRRAVRVARADAELLGFDVAPGFIDALARSDFRRSALPPGSRLCVVAWPGPNDDVEAFIAIQREAGITVEQVTLQAADRPAWDDAHGLEDQVFPRRSVAEVAVLLAGARA